MTQYSMKVPDLGEGVVEVEVVEWHISPGEHVAEDQHIVDLMTDKVTVELTSPVSGMVLSLSGAAGDVVPVGANLISFELESVTTETARDSDSSAAQQSSPPETSVGFEDKLLSPVVETADAGSAGTEGAAGSDVEVDARIQQSTVKTLNTHDSAGRKGRALASPAVRRRAREARIELAQISGTGKGGRVTHEDLNEFLGRDATRVAQQAGIQRAGTTSHRLVGIRRTVASRMSLSKRTIPHFSYVEEVDMTDLEKLRRTLNERAGADQPRLTYLPFILCALKRMLVEFPQCNAHFDEQSGEVTEFADFHAGIATQTDAGLMVPVLRDVQDLDIWSIALGTERLADGARNKLLGVNDYKGSTITLTSLGKLGGLVSTPIINPPETTIIGINKIVERPVVRNDQIERRLMMNLSSSFDHRIVDGHDAACLIQGVKEMLEVPALLFI